MASSFVSCFARPASALAAAAWLIAASHTHAQISEAGFPTSILNAQHGTSGGSVQQVWGAIPTFNYGFGSDANGVSGRVTHTYQAGLLTNITVFVSELRNSNNQFVVINDPWARNWGVVQFTPAINTPYQLGGVIDLAMTGNASSMTSGQGSLSLAQVGGPTLASYGASVVRNTNSSLIGSIYDSATPLFGSSNGILLAGLTYRLSWDFRVDSTINGDPSLSANVTSLREPPSFSIAFLPSPGSAAILGVGGLMASRRRRSAAV